ncbi:hypothetical protein PV04_01116 [Phialophora macrospora]|uniref:Carboxylesterase type B domain-containing protein n=1 Tax=Phialophora macrospora TaxID=1851006 RepID=A0A0D2GKP9_9EURO|nr:hypothetical protein PV04_01116 [Phialophora macrospora]
MDKLPPLGREVPSTVSPTYEIYGPLLSAAATAIHHTQRHEFSYGPHPRHKLDLYSPSAEAGADPAAQPRRRVLVFVYGGGFVSGDKRLAGVGTGPHVQGDVAYANIGHFFAEKFRLETVVMDYRLLGHGAAYASGAEDVDLCLRWVAARYGSPARARTRTRAPTPAPSPAEVYVLGNSAGAVHVASWLFGDKWARSRRPESDSDTTRLEAVGLLGCPFRLDPEGSMGQPVTAYYGTAGDARLSEPTSLMLRAMAISGLSGTGIVKWPRVMTMVSEFDPENIVEAGREFARLWSERGGRGGFIEIPGHNHISPALSLGTGIAAEEEWGVRFGRWLTEGG